MGAHLRRMGRLVAGTRILNPLQVYPDLKSSSPKITSSLVGETTILKPRRVVY